ncbi:hypothetical protein D9758_012733 [Tetrapyrgos nigripes]|uniref:Uncharacterized protein n=1 Tax=Tetrapyrgos nigripes TaxID=182062 RepID=A0A8H5CXS4_9AGAR|nr:hypothetical protein D9758_012733 [Tetrapyrgos nigripes]
MKTSTEIVQKTILRIDDPELSGFFKFLTLPSLSNLTISGVKDDGEGMCHLTSLSLENLPLQDMEVIALLQVLPCLTALHISERHLEVDEGSDQESFRSPFTGFFSDFLTVNYRKPSSSTLLSRLKEQRARPALQ